MANVCDAPISGDEIVRYLYDARQITLFTLDHQGTIFKRTCILLGPPAPISRVPPELRILYTDIPNELRVTPQQLSHQIQIDLAAYPLLPIVDLGRIYRRRQICTQVRQGYAIEKVLEALHRRFNVLVPIMHQYRTNLIPFLQQEVFQVNELFNRANARAIISPLELAELEQLIARDYSNLTRQDVQLAALIRAVNLLPQRLQPYM